MVLVESNYLLPILSHMGVRLAPESDSVHGCGGQRGGGFLKL